MSHLEEALMEKVATVRTISKTNFSEGLKGLKMSVKIVTIIPIYVQHFLHRILSTVSFAKQIHPLIFFSAKGYRALQGWVDRKTVSIFLRWQEKQNVSQLNLRLFTHICYQQYAVKKEKEKETKWGELTA